MLIKYRSNNSGGDWWLKDKDWKALAEAGWGVEWVKGGKHLFTDKGGTRWLGALATSASKDFPTVRECLQEFERITRQDVSDKGCGCCGAPHSFSWEGGYCSGSDCLEYLYDDPPKNLREAIEKLQARP